MKRVMLSLVTVVTILSSTHLAFAHHIVVRDGSSERGLLDVRRVKNLGRWTARWRIDTYHRWSRRQIWDQGYLLVYLDTFGSRRHDYYALIYATEKNVRGTLFRDRDVKPDRKVRDLRVRRPSPKSVNVTVQLKKLRIGNDRATYNWFAQTTWSGGKCWQACFDYAPDTGENGEGIEEPLPLSL